MLRQHSYPGQMELADQCMKKLLMLWEAYLEDGQGVLGEYELCPAVGVELVVEEEREGLNQGASSTCSINTRTDGIGAVTCLTLDLVVAHSALNGRVVGAEDRYDPLGALLGAPRGALTAHQ